MTAFEIIDRLIAFGAVAGAISYVAVIFATSRDAMANRYCQDTYYAFSESIPPRWFRIVSLIVTAICAGIFYSTDMTVSAMAMVGAGATMHAAAIYGRNVGRRLGMAL